MVDIRSGAQDSSSRGAPVLEHRIRGSSCRFAQASCLVGRAGCRSKGSSRGAQACGRSGGTATSEREGGKPARVDAQESKVDPYARGWKSCCTKRVGDFCNVSQIICSVCLYIWRLSNILIAYITCFRIDIVKVKQQDRAIEPRHYARAE